MDVRFEGADDEGADRREEQADGDPAGAAVATYSMITKSPKKSSEVPRSRSRTSTPTLSSQIATIGPSTRPVGSWSFQILRPV